MGGTRTATDNDSAGTLLMHIAGTDGARPNHGAIAHCKYGLLALRGAAVDPAAAGDQGSRDGHEATRGTSDQVRKEMEEGDKTRQHALPARGMQ